MYPPPPSHPPAHPSILTNLPHSTQFRGNASTLSHPLAIAQAFPHVGSSAPLTICPEDDPCATPPARPATTGPLLSTFKTKRPIINCLAMAKRLSNASSPFSSPLVFSSNTKRLVAAVDASRAIHLMSAAACVGSPSCRSSAPRGV